MGYRSVSVDGSQDKYREDVDLDDGPVLFDLKLRLVPEGQVRRFADEIYIDVANLGAQPFETLTFGVTKRGAFKFKWDRRESSYFYDNLLAVNPE